MSFLATQDEMRADLAAVGFEVAEFRDTTAANIEMQSRSRERLERGELPPVAVDIIMAERAREMQINTMRSLAEGRTATVEALAVKPG